MPADEQFTQALAWGDVDGDGDLDLVLGNYGQQSRLYRNDGSGVFVDVTATHLPAIADGTSAVALGDVDGDGDLDLVVGESGTNVSPGQERLLANTGNGVFVDVTAAQMPVLDDVTYCLALVDVDGDGDL
ncbi:MAG: VCBS repeat-containing protein, partial [Planctomycetes bacterium]|nr:VCBS repeat-containing protein [Planctomycetota bacterium]